MKNANLNFLWIALIFLGISLSSCDKDDGNAKISLKAVTTSSQSTTPLKNVAANELVFTSGHILFREVVFDGDNANTSVSITHEQIASIDYATGIVSPPVIIEVPAGEYSSVYLGIEIQDDGADPTIVTEGTYTNSQGDIIPIRFEFNSGEVFEAEAAKVTINEGADMVAKITFDANFWFGTVTKDELDNATMTNGIIIISSTSNPDIFDKVAARVDVATEAVFE